MTIINTVGGPAPKPIYVEAVEDTPSTLPHTYAPGEGYDYLSSVTVGKDPNLVPENVKKDVSIFGTVGTLESGGSGSIGPDTYVSYDDYTNPPRINIMKSSDMWTNGTPVEHENVGTTYCNGTSVKCIVNNRSILVAYRAYTTNIIESYEYREYTMPSQHLEVPHISKASGTMPFFTGDTPNSSAFGGKVFNDGDAIDLWLIPGSEAFAAYHGDVMDHATTGRLTFNSTSINDAVISMDVPEIKFYVRSDAADVAVGFNMYYGEVVE